MAVYALAGFAFGTCLYLARTRLSDFVKGRRWPFFLAACALAGGLFFLATRFEADARRAAEEVEDLEARLDRLRRR
jgi:hypothetical protein